MDPAELARAVLHLQRGGIVAAATESFFALLVDAASGSALDRVFALKGRTAAKGVALIVPSVASWHAWVTHVPPLASELARRFWPGPLTIALPAAVGVDARLVVHGTVGVRMPGASVALDLARAFGGALTATSANLAGEPPMTESHDVRSTLGVADATLVVLSGTCPGGLPSTIVSVAGERWEIARPGAIESDAITDVAARFAGTAR